MGPLSAVLLSNTITSDISEIKVFVKEQINKYVNVRSASYPPWTTPQE